MDPDQHDVERLRRGDLAGLAGILERYQDRLFRYVWRLTGDEALAEDVFQQTWLQVAERVARYDARRPFAPWLFTVARNLALDQLRRLRPGSLDDVDEPAAPEAGGDPLALATAGERADRVARALAGLGPLDREVLTLRFDEDLSLPELAAVLAVPMPTAKARLYRALTRLRGRLLALAPAEQWS